MRTLQSAVEVATDKICEAWRAGDHDAYTRAWERVNRAAHDMLFRLRQVSQIGVLG